MPGILSRMLPREVSFYTKFNELAGNVQAGSKALVQMLDNYTDAAIQAENIKTIEHRGDNITHDIITQLNKTFITPFDREDIHALSSKVDDILDLIDAVAGRLITYRVQRIRPGVADLARILRLATVEVVAAVKALERPNDILKHCIEINRLENDADRLSRTLIAGLFEEEKDPVEIIKWKEIIEVLETATDKCEDVANVIESVVLKSA